jgi:hypothetical protein
MYIKAFLLDRDSKEFSIALTVFTRIKASYLIGEETKLMYLS